MVSFYCKACDQEVDSNACRLADIIETSGGRLYVFECCDCGEVSSSELLQEYEDQTNEYRKTKGFVKYFF